MKFFKKNIDFWPLLLAVLLISCGSSESQPVLSYYNYDAELPLEAETKLINQQPQPTGTSYASENNLSIRDSQGIKPTSGNENNEIQEFAISFNSVHDIRINGILTIPKNAKSPAPVIILLHGLGDHKKVDYIAYGTTVFNENNYAVLRIDVSNHGERQINDYDFDLTGDYKYWTRDIISQTVFDLRRAVDYIATNKNLDQDKIGFYGVSLGGIIGAVLCGVEKRVKVPVFTIAGGQLNLLYGTDALSTDVNNFIGIIEPLNFIEAISPRPILMLNASNDEVVPPLMSKLLYKKANEPKKIIWYPSKHRNIPQDKVFIDGVNWYNTHL